MVDFGESVKMIKANRKMDKSNTYNGFSSNILFFIQGRTKYYYKIHYKCLIYPFFYLFLSYIMQFAIFIDKEYHL